MKDSDVFLTATPFEALETAYENLRDELAEELLGKLKKVSPVFFERIVVELLVKMGYGGSRADAGKAIGRSGDGGCDFSGQFTHLMGVFFKSIHPPFFRSIHPPEKGVFQPNSPAP